jgi:hypothetical protein
VNTFFALVRRIGQPHFAHVMDGLRTDDGHPGPQALAWDEYVTTVQDVLSQTRESPESSGSLAALGVICPWARREA